METIEIAINPATKSDDWQRLATKQARAEAERRGIQWIDAKVLIRLPERGRCLTKDAGFTQLVAHG